MNKYSFISMWVLKHCFGVDYDDYIEYMEKKKLFTTPHKKENNKDIIEYPEEKEGFIEYQGLLIDRRLEDVPSLVREVYVFEDNCAKILYVYNGEILKIWKAERTYNGFVLPSLLEGNFRDYDVYKDCEKKAIEQAKKIVEELHIKSNSEMVIEVEVTTYKVKKILVGKKFEYLQDEGYNYDRFDEKKEIVWSSRKDLKESEWVEE